MSLIVCSPRRNCGSEKSQTRAGSLSTFTGSEFQHSVAWNSAPCAFTRQLQSRRIEATAMGALVGILRQPRHRCASHSRRTRQDYEHRHDVGEEARAKGVAGPPVLGEGGDEEPMREHVHCQQPGQPVTAVAPQRDDGAEAGQNQDGAEYQETATRAEEVGAERFSTRRPEPISGGVPAAARCRTRPD